MSKAARRLAWGLLALGAGAVAGPGEEARAGVRVEQAVSAVAGGKSGSAKHTWTIDEDKFHLLITDGGGGETRYVFNGRTLYACGKLDADDEKLLAGALDSDPALKAKLRGGVCQAAPSNFVARFFLSPQAAVGSVDRADGMRVTLAMKSYALTKDGKAQTVHGQGCDGMKRSYELARVRDGGAAVLATAASETLCAARALGWRRGLWVEVAKMVLRQPGGAALLKELRKDNAGLTGLALAGEGQQTLTDAKGKTHAASWTLATTAVRTEEIPASAFSTPPGYEIVSPESIRRLAAAPADGGKAAAGAAAGAKKAEPGLLDMVEATFFCAVAGGFACLLD